jgi:glycosyltransferase involved in cell wall biosynthesis
MACGLPAITSDLVGCAPDLISDGFTGFSYTCGDSDTLAKYLVYMAENEDQAREMGNNAQKLINCEYTLEKVVASIELAMARING